MLKNKIFLNIRDIFTLRTTLKYSKNNSKNVQKEIKCPVHECKKSNEKSLNWTNN